MLNTATQAAARRAAPADSLDEAMTDFLSILQALDATVAGENMMNARNYLCERLREVYDRLEDLHHAGQVH